MPQQLPDDPAAPKSEKAVDDAWVLGPDPARRAPVNRRRALIASVSGALVVVAAAYLVGYAKAGDRLPSNATISGVAVGGLDRAAASDKLTAALAPLSERPIRVTLGDRTAKVVPADAGLAFDIPASIDSAGGGNSADPRQIWRVLTGGAATDASVRVDDARLDATIRTLAEKYDTLPVNAHLRLDGSTVEVRPAAEGATLSTESATASLQQAFADQAGTVELAVDAIPPEISTEEAQRVRTDFAAPAVSAPISVSAGQAGTFDVTPKMIAGALSFRAVDGALVPELDADLLRDLADDAFGELEIDRAKDATVRMVDGKPEVIPAVNGSRLTAEDLAEAVEPALTKRGSARTALVELSGAQAEFSTADAEKLGITEITGRFTTEFPYASYRNVNIGRAAELVNGTLLKPGETFSLNDIVGERTKANGFTEGNIITGGKFRLELGGGVSQSATTTFNAMFFAGLKDVEHRPHTLYIDRYPAGREATVAWPSVDLKFQNDTDYGVLVEAKRVKAAPGRQGSLTVRMWSTKTYDKITSTKLTRSNFTTGRDIEDSSSKCQPMSPVPGFDVNYSRLFHRDGEVVKREKFFWRYHPTDRVRCT